MDQQEFYNRMRSLQRYTSSGIAKEIVSIQISLLTSQFRYQIETKTHTLPFHMMSYTMSILVARQIENQSKYNKHTNK